MVNGSERILKVILRGVSFINQNGEISLTQGAYNADCITSATRAECAACTEKRSRGDSLQ